MKANQVTKFALIEASSHLKYVFIGVKPKKRELQTQVGKGASRGHRFALKS
jgi:hypothetical protein